jgi:uncharacterized protein (DUF2141 family)
MKLLILLLCMLFSASTVPTATLTIEIANVRTGSGKLWFALFRPGEKFVDSKPNIHKIVEVKSVANQIAVFQLEPDRYAMAVYHDLNANDVLDKNFLGIPKEPYGFSRDFRPRFSPPSFEDCAFDLPANGAKIVVKLTN